ncbi:MAG TPA: hypothetical protein VGL54_07315 [Solirubrobacteraceae bacterium]
MATASSPEGRLSLRTNGLTASLLAEESPTFVARTMILPSPPACRFAGTELDVNCHHGNSADAGAAPNNANDNTPTRTTTGTLFLIMSMGITYRSA